MVGKRIRSIGGMTTGRGKTGVLEENLSEYQIFYHKSNMDGGWN
jgi:hypothetical protein